MTYLEKISTSIITISKRLFLGTWVQRLPFTEWIYKKVFYLGRKKEEQEIIFNGHKLIVHSKDSALTPNLITGGFEKYELSIFSRLLSPDMTVLDIGANIGIYTIPASHIVGKRGHIYSFEPVPENFDLLTRNVALNNLKNVTLINNAIGSKPGKVKMSIVKDSLATHHITKGSKDGLEVDVITIDNFVKKNKLKVDVVKMDIEGYEGFAIDGAANLLKRKNLILITEFSADFIQRSGKEPSIVAKKLYKSFLNCYTIDEEKLTLRPIKNWQDMLDPKNHDFVLCNKTLNL